MRRIFCRSLLRKAPSGEIIYLSKGGFLNGPRTFPAWRSFKMTSDTLGANWLAEGQLSDTTTRSAGGRPMGTPNLTSLRIISTSPGGTTSGNHCSQKLYVRTLTKPQFGLATGTGKHPIWAPTCETHVPPWTLGTGLALALLELVAQGGG